MENDIHEQEKQKKRVNTLYIVIGGLALALVIQSMLFMNKVSSIQKEFRNTSTAKTTPRSSPAISNPNYRRQNPGYAAALGNLNQAFSEDPFSTMERLHDRIYQMMNTARAMAPAMAQQFGQELNSDFSPAIDMEETEAAYIVHCDIPGLDKEKINITTKNGLLVIQGIRETGSQQQDDQSGFYTMERSYGSFARTVPLPGPVDESKIKAEYKDGVLDITLPKENPGQSAAKKITVQ